MATRKIGVYAGTFDPLTLGHLWMIERGTELFDQLIVAIGLNPDKRAMFSEEERLEMLRESVSDFDNVRVDAYLNQYLIYYANGIGAQFILRGIRSPGDYEYEHNMRNINGDLNGDITTIFLMPPRELAEISSSMVKGLIGPVGWEELVSKMVTPPVFDKLKKVYAQRVASVNP